MGGRFSAAADVLRRAQAHLVFPAAVAEIGDATHPLWTGAFGTQTFDPASPAAAPDTVFDLASLTKVLSTTSLAMRLAEQGAIGLDDPVSLHVERWRGGDREQVTIRDLLSHTSGLPAHRPYYQSLSGRAAYEAAICSEPLAYAPRSQSTYSDLGFMLLGFIVERGHTLTGQFDALKAQAIPADDVQFLPPANWLRRTAPTEIDWWRGRLLRGEVHDENTFALGGAAGQAGLFGTASAVGSFARHLLQILAGRRGVFQAATVREFSSRRTDVPGSRALGWDTMLPTSSCGTRMSEQAFGHTGFTGTSLWVDPVRGVYAVLLTNRVHPTRAGSGIQEARRAFHDAAMAAL